jgi:hypothetical protein
MRNCTVERYRKETIEIRADIKELKCKKHSRLGKQLVLEDKILNCILYVNH